jgi:SAM-dependent methyltransferase
MGNKRHKRTRDVPHHAGEGRARCFFDGDQVHSHRKRTVRKKIGAGGGTRGRPIDAATARPLFCMLFDDLAQEESSTAVFGMYPAALIPKLMPWLRCERREVLHVCSGGLPRGEGIRVDMRREARPDIIADGRALPLADASVAAVLLDPPYSEHYARELYGTDYPRPAHLLAEAARVVRPGGRIGFVHYIVPNPPNGCHHVKTFGLSMGFGYPMRAVTLFEREQSSLLEGIA